MLGIVTFPSLILLLISTDSCCHHPGVPVFHDALKVRNKQGEIARAFPERKIPRESETGLLLSGLVLLPEANCRFL